MARARKAVYSRRYRQPSLLNTLLFKLSTFTYPEFPMPTSRRNVFIRTVATITGDISAAAACATAAVWIIEAAALGLFLSFLVWLIAAIASLALSQYVVHPVVSVALSDKKLDMAVSAMSGLVQRFSQKTNGTFATA